MSILLDEHLWAQINDRIVASPTLPDDLEIFSTYVQGDNDYVYNVDCWAAGLDLSGVGWRTKVDGVGVEGKRGTLISPRHVICAEHVGPEVADEFHFIKANGDQIVRTVTGIQHVAGDIRLAYLNEDIPSGVTFYKALPSDYTDFLQYDANNLPCIGESHTNGLYGQAIFWLDQERKALIGQIGGIAVLPAPAKSIYFVQGTENRADYWEDAVIGDSGWPGFLVVNNELLLLELHLTIGILTGCGPFCGGPFYTLKIDAINQAMEDLEGGAGAGYQLTEFDLAGLQAQFTGGLNLRGLSEGLYSAVTLPKRFHLEVGQTYQDGQVEGETYQDGAIKGQVYQDGAVEMETAQ